MPSCSALVSRRTGSVLLEFSDLLTSLQNDVSRVNLDLLTPLARLVDGSLLVSSLPFVMVVSAAQRFL